MRNKVYNPSFSINKDPLIITILISCIIIENTIRIGIAQWFFSYLYSINQTQSCLNIIYSIKLKRKY